MNMFVYIGFVIIILLIVSSGSSLDDEQKADFQQTVIQVIPEIEQNFNNSFSTNFKTIQSENFINSIQYLVKSALYSFQASVYFAFAIPEILPDAAIFINDNFNLIILVIIILLISPLFGPLMILLIGTGLFFWDLYKNNNPKKAYWRRLNEDDN